jgi:hypothetical protein
MKRRPFCFPIVFSLLAASACGSNSPVTDDAGTVDVAPANPGLDGSESEAGEMPAVARGIAVVNSDYQSASVSFLDRDGNLLKDSCFNSGSGAQGLSMALSGDVALPTQTQLGGPVVVIDRLNSALTWLDPITCAPLRQLAVGTGFASNPHDFVWLSASKAYVPRFGDNAAATPAPDDLDDGSDLLIIDPTQPKILGRIDLKPFAPAGTKILPMADRALLAGGLVYVSLNAISGDWSNYGEGRIVIVDPNTDQVVGVLDTPGVKNCGAMTYLATEKRLLVACNGDTNAGPAQAAGSAIVAFDLSTLPATLVAQVGSVTASTPPYAQVGTAAAGGLPYSNWAVAALDGNTVLAKTDGDFSNSPPDQLWSLSLAGAPSTKIFASSEAFSLGAILVDPEKGRFFVADGPTKSSSAIRVFDYASGTITATGTIKSNPSHKLPPRALAWY